MPNIVHRIGIENTSPEEVYHAIATREGLAGWWTETVHGESRVDGVLQFRFPNTGPDFEVLELVPNKRVSWKCIVGADEWLDTHIEFDLSFADGETVLQFKHSGWRRENEFMHHCSTQWAYFLIGLKVLVETGRGTPFASNYQPISRWSPRPS
jgi:uncharacterized protein YndB with AHSA1/START domain